MDHELPAVQAVADQLKQVLLNLVLNAAEAMADKLRREADRFLGRRGGDRQDAARLEAPRAARRRGARSDAIRIPWLTTRPALLSIIRPR